MRMPYKANIKYINMTQAIIYYYILYANNEQIVLRL